MSDENDYQAAREGLSDALGAIAEDSSAAQKRRPVNGSRDGDAPRFGATEYADDWA